MKPPHLPALATFLISGLPLSAQAFTRELSADRPDTTESPITVEAGRFQVESGLVSFGRDRSQGITTETWSLAETNVKFGLTDSADLQWVLRPWIRETERGNGERNRAEGFGDLDLRLKYNLWGNDGGTTAAALMPYVTAPTRTAASAGEWQGGMIFPVSISLNETFDAGFQLETARVWDEDLDHVWDLLHSAVLGIGLTDRLGMFIEYVGIAGERPYEASAFTGFTWTAGENLQWDLAFGVGLNEAAEDFSIAHGVTFRF